MTGTIRVRGQDYVVDAIERLDHSWGHRDPLKMNAQNSISAAFDDDGLAFHIITAVDLDAPNGADHALAHGYVHEDGVTYGVQSLELTSTRLRGLVTAMEMVVTDVRGKRFHLFAMPDVGGPWNAYSGTVTYTFRMTWVLGGRKGYGCVMETIGQPALERPPFPPLHRPPTRHRDRLSLQNRQTSATTRAESTKERIMTGRNQASAVALAATLALSTGTAAAQDSSQTAQTQETGTTATTTAERAGIV